MNKCYLYRKSFESKDEADEGKRTTSCYQYDSSSNHQWRGKCMRFHMQIVRNLLPIMQMCVHFWNNDRHAVWWCWITDRSNIWSNMKTHFQIEMCWLACHSFCIQPMTETTTKKAVRWFSVKITPKLSRTMPSQTNQFCFLWWHISWNLICDKCQLKASQREIWLL